jgi:hypothetical protein
MRLRPVDLPSVSCQTIATFPDELVEESVGRLVVVSEVSKRLYTKAVPAERTLWIKGVGTLAQ